MALGQNYQQHVKFYSNPRRRGAAGGKAVIQADDVVADLRTKTGRGYPAGRGILLCPQSFWSDWSIRRHILPHFSGFQDSHGHVGVGCMCVQMHRTRAAVKMYRAGLTRHRFIHALYSEVCDRHHILDGLYRWIAIDTTIQYHLRNSNCQLFCADILRVGILPSRRNELEERGVCWLFYFNF